jgi:cytochrome c oxidase assembly protein subunit 15
VSTVTTSPSASSCAVPIARAPSSRPRAIAAWLFVCAALVFGIIVVGGVTRLTHSGLSIAEWKPIMGTLPPLSEAAWDDVFAKYKLTPEYRHVNGWMTLHDFKGIFWWEYVHRLLGRLIGVAYFLPLLWFAVRRQIPTGYAGRLAMIFVLGGLQGLLGWLMVKSGLVDNPRDSHLRLTAHLGLAVLILGAMVWTGLSLLYPVRAGRERAAAIARRWATGVVGLVGLMVLTGGLVAGLRAGFAFNTWPLMGNSFVPPMLLHLRPWWQNVFSNIATVQFDHRLIAYVLIVAASVLWWKTFRNRSLPVRARYGATALVAMVLVQATLGIATLLLVVPIVLASLHQACAIVVFALALNVAHALR